MASQLIQALQALYHSENPAVRDQADRWLEHWQQGSEAWSVADAVLHDPASSMEAQYFCAQTLRTKVQRDFEELPAQAVGSLRDSLLTLLVKYCKGSPPVRTQLCLALASMAVHVPHDRWTSAGQGGSTVTGAVRWFAEKLCQLPVETALPCLLELLAVLPQEAGGQRVSVRPERRRQYMQELKASVGAALEILSSCIAQPNSSGRTREQVLEAFGSWMRLASTGPTSSSSNDRSTVGGFNGDQLAKHPLVVAALEGLASTDTFYASVDAVCELVWVTVDFETHAVLPSMMALVQVLVPAVMQLRPRFQVAAHRLQAEMEGKSFNSAGDEFDDDEDTAKGMARLFSEVGEAYINLIASALPEVRAPVEAMLEVASYPDFNICAMSFNFWCRLAKRLKPTSDGESPTNSTDAEQQRRREYFKPAFEKLAVHIRGRVRYPESMSQWSKEARQDFKHQRYDVADTLEDACSVLGFSAALTVLLEPLHSLSKAVAAGAPFDWKAAEATLFCVRSICSHAALVNDPQLLQLLEALPGMPAKEGLLQHMACCVVAEYARWLGAAIASGQHGTRLQEEGGLLQRLLSMATSAMDLQDATAAASSALSKLADSCGQHLASVMPTLLQLYNAALLAGVGTTIGAAPPQTLSALCEDDVNVIMRAVCIATCKCVPPDQIPQAANVLLQPVINTLQKAVQQIASMPAPPPPPPVPQGMAQQPGAANPAPMPLSKQFPFLCPLLDRVSTILESIDSKPAVAEMLARSWPTVDAVFERGCGDGQIVERACRVTRMGIKMAGTASTALVPMLLSALPARFKQTRHSAFLYLLSEVVKVFGGDATHQAALAPALHALIIDSLSNLKGLRALEQHPETVDDTYLLAARALSYCPSLLLSAEQNATAALVALMDVAMCGVVMQHREANGSVLAFLARLLNPQLLPNCPQAAAQVLQALLANRAPTIVRLLLAGVAGAVPQSRIPDISHTLLALLRAAGDQGLTWITEVLMMLPDSAVPSSDKESLLGSARLVVSHSFMTQESRNFEAAIDEFSDLCRRTHRTRSALLQVLLPPELIGS